MERSIGKSKRDKVRRGNLLKVITKDLVIMPRILGKEN